jgi:hypothetical protein
LAVTINRKISKKAKCGIGCQDFEVETGLIGCITEVVEKCRERFGSVYIKVESIDFIVALESKSL